MVVVERPLGRDHRGVAAQVAARCSGPQSRPPRATSYTNVRKNSTEKIRSPTNPNAPSSRWTTAYGYRKMISMSNMMNSIATT